MTEISRLQKLFYNYKITQNCNLDIAQNCNPGVTFAYKKHKREYIEIDQIIDNLAIYKYIHDNRERWNSLLLEHGYKFSSQTVDYYKGSTIIDITFDQIEIFVENKEKIDYDFLGSKCIVMTQLSDIIGLLPKYEIKMNDVMIEINTPFSFYEHTTVIDGYNPSFVVNKLPIIKLIHDNYENIVDTLLANDYREIGKGTYVKNTKTVYVSIFSISIAVAEPGNYSSINWLLSSQFLSTTQVDSINIRSMDSFYEYVQLNVV